MICQFKVALFYVLCHQPKKISHSPEATGTGTCRLQQTLERRYLYKSSVER